MIPTRQDFRPPIPKTSQCNTYSKFLHTQRNKVETFPSAIKRTIWRRYLKSHENIEYRIIIQIHSIQHPQNNQSHHNVH
ncbi:MAG: hypothetical protein WAZ77_01850, partial [Candidatus Nitrosopolaris sp.]